MSTYCSADAGWLECSPKFLNCMLEQHLPGFPVSTAPLWDLIRTHITAAGANANVYSSTELVALAPVIHDLLRVSQAYITHFAPFIKPNKSSQVNDYTLILKAVIQARHSLDSLLVALSYRIDKERRASAAVSVNVTADPALATSAYVDLLRSHVLANYALMHIVGWTTHLHNNFFNQQKAQQQQQQRKQLKQEQKQGKQRQGKQKQPGPTGPAAPSSNSSSTSSASSSTSTSQVPVSFQDLQLHLDHQSFVGVSGGESTLAAHATYYESMFALISGRKAANDALVGLYVHGHTLTPVEVLRLHFEALCDPPAASPQWRAQQHQVLSPGDPQLLSCSGAGAGVMKLLLEALVFAGRLGDLDLVLQVMEALGQAANASSRADREGFLMTRGQLLLQVIAVYLRESSEPEQGKHLKQPRQLKTLQPGKNGSLPGFLQSYVLMICSLVRTADGEDATKYGK